MNNLFKPNQIIAGNQIINYFKEGISKYCLLEAQMQSGKTGTYNWVIKCILEEKLVENILIISGSNEVLLKNQAIKDLQYYNPELIHYCNIHFRNDLKKIKTIKNTLIIIDESHLDQSNDQQMSIFLQEFGLWADGNINSLNNTNTYILSVSATPFSEKSDIYYGKSSNSKKIVKLIPGIEYKGVKFFMDNNLIHETFDILNNFNKFKDLILCYGNKYNIIRILFDNNITETLLKLNDENLINIYVYDSTKNTSIYLSNEERIFSGGSSNIPTLEVEPNKPSLIIIKGKLRVGKVLPKQHIGFVWENSKNPNSDTILQGLLGRCCGYHNYYIDIYITNSLLEKCSMNGGPALTELERFYTDGYIPTTGNNLKNPILKIISNHKNNKHENIKSTVPIKIVFNENDNNDEFNEYDIIFNSNNSNIKREIIYNKLKDNNFELINNSNINKGQLAEVINTIKYNINLYSQNKDNTNVSIRNYEDSKYIGELEKLTNSYKNKIPYKGNHGKLKDKYLDIIISIIYPNYKFINNDCKAGDVYVFFYTKLSELIINTDNLVQCITETTGNEIFGKLSNDVNTIDLKEYTDKPEDLINTLKNSIKKYKDSFKRLSKKRYYKMILHSALLDTKTYFNDNKKINKNKASNTFFWKNINNIEKELDIEININKKNLIKLGNKNVKIKEITWKFIGKKNNDKPFILKQINNEIELGQDMDNDRYDINFNINLNS